MLIARQADGGMRDANSLLDLCMTASTDITVQTVSDCAGLVGQAHLFDIAKGINAADIGIVLRVLESLWEKSIDYQRLCEQLIGFYRNLMIAKSVPKPEELIACLPDELERYRAMAKELPMERILACMTGLQDTLGRMSRTSQRRTELEMGLLKLCSLQPEKNPVADLAAHLEQLERKFAAGIPAAAPASAEQKPAPMPTPTEEEIEKTPVEPFVRWGEVLAILEAKNKALYGALVNSSAYTGGGLLLVDAGENSVFAQMMRGDTYAKESLRDALATVTGEKYKLGPYSAKKYEIKKAGLAELDGFLQKASDLGVDVKIK
jgi:DNA polymerase-3 subunit gamma/tau